MRLERKDRAERPRQPTVQSDSKVRERCKRMGTPELMDWADGSLVRVGQALTKHSRNPQDGDTIRLALIEAEALVEVVRELVERELVPEYEGEPTAPGPNAGLVRASSW